MDYLLVSHELGEVGAEGHGTIVTYNYAEGKKTSDRQFLEKKMAERYQIFQRKTGDRVAARRVDYR